MFFFPRKSMLKQFWLKSLNRGCYLLSSWGNIPNTAHSKLLQFSGRCLPFYYLHSCNSHTRLTTLFFKSPFFTPLLAVNPIAEYQQYPFCDELYSYILFFIVHKCIKFYKYLGLMIRNILVDLILISNAIGGSRYCLCFFFISLSIATPC